MSWWNRAMTAPSRCGTHANAADPALQPLRRSPIWSMRSTRASTRPGPHRTACAGAHANECPPCGTTRRRRSDRGGGRTSPDADDGSRGGLRGSRGHEWTGIGQHTAVDARDDRDRRRGRTIDPGDDDFAGGETSPRAADSVDATERTRNLPHRGQRPQRRQDGRSSGLAGPRHRRFPLTVQPT